MFTPFMRKLLNTSGASLIQVMVIVGVMGIMTGVFIQEADLQNKSTYGIRKKGETDELLNEIRLQLGNPANVATMLAGTQTDSSGTVTLPFALGPYSVTVTGINFTVTTPAVGTLNPPIEPNEVIYTLDINILRNATARGMNIAASANRQLTLRVFRDGTQVYTGYPEESEAYYARIFCKMIGGRILGNGQCDNQFEAKSCLMMGGRWIPDAQGLLTPPMSAVGTCEKGKDTCAWLTKPELAADDPARYDCWNSTLNKCEFPTAGTWSTLFTNPPQVTNPWKACADDPTEPGASACERQKDPECIEGFCNGNCLDAPPTGLYADAQFGAAKPGPSLIAVPYGQNPNTVSNFTTYSLDSNPPTCAVYGQYTDAVGGAGPWTCDTTLNDCYENLNCTGYSCIASSANYCDPTSTANSPTPAVGGGQYIGSLTGSSGRRYDSNILNSGGPYPGGTCGVNWSGSVTWSGTCNAGTCRETGTMSCNANGCGNCSQINPPTAASVGALSILSNDGNTVTYERACVIDATWPDPGVAASWPCNSCVNQTTVTCGAQCGGTCSGLNAMCGSLTNGHNAGSVATCSNTQAASTCNDIPGGLSAKVFGIPTNGACSAVCPTTSGTRSVDTPWTRTCDNPAPSCDGATCVGALSGTDTTSEACSITCAPPADCVNGASCSVTACTDGTCSAGSKKCQRTVSRDAGNDCGDMEVIFQAFIGAPASCVAESDCPSDVTDFPSGKCSDGGNVADATMFTEYSCVSDSATQTCGSCPCTPSCPATSTYCPGDEPSDGCSGTCPTGTKSSGCGGTCCRSFYYFQDCVPTPEFNSGTCTTIADCTNDMSTPPAVGGMCTGPAAGVLRTSDCDASACSLSSTPIFSGGAPSCDGATDDRDGGNMPVDPTNVNSLCAAGSDNGAACVWDGNVGQGCSGSVCMFNCCDTGGSGTMTGACAF